MKSRLWVSCVDLRDSYVQFRYIHFAGDEFGEKKVTGSAKHVILSFK
jgi:hypothetical protein